MAQQTMMPCCRVLWCSTVTVGMDLTLARIVGLSDSMPLFYSIIRVILVQRNCNERGVGAVAKLLILYYRI
ncbi:hypothetical protein CEXT_412131 [Caerostris extrusa]|uniref:Secreted protein n=1 Tax=Caerostris extrusa TaxID=172846 RepID=A0AAV4NTH3_CAEEX|nr:hypothetical protein CEXT_412131 [Caerostris extrusa]